jgi:TrmH RNA methyltransferase
VYHGVRACAALFARRPQDIVRVYLSSARQREFAALLAWCGRERKGFQIVAAENLQRLTGSLHHEGVAILAKSLRRLDMADLLRGIEGGTITGPLVYLDGVQNPHNLGSILRTAAHFGAGAILGRLGELPPLSPSAVRVAEGAAEHVPVADLADPLVDLARLKVAGFQVVATTSHAGQPLFGAPLGERLVIVLGSEGEGMSRPLAAAADLTVQIPGTGAVESLNVSVAAGILLGEAWRRRPPPKGVPTQYKPRTEVRGCGGATAPNGYQESN